MRATSGPSSFATATERLSATTARLSATTATGRAGCRTARPPATSRCPMPWGVGVGGVDRGKYLVAAGSVDREARPDQVVPSPVRSARTGSPSPGLHKPCGRAPWRREAGRSVCSPDVLSCLDDVRHIAAFAWRRNVRHWRADPQLQHSEHVFEHLRDPVVSRCGGEVVGGGYRVWMTA